MRKTFHFVLFLVLLLTGYISFVPDSTIHQTVTNDVSVDAKATSTIEMPSTSIPTQTLSSPTVIATLTPNEREMFISTWVNKNEDCNAPCFWGTNPGKTTSAEIVDLFANLGLEPWIANNTNQIVYSADIVLSDGLSILPAFFVQNDYLTSVEVDISPKKTIDGKPRGWLTYSPETLISRYGTPSKIGFAIDWGPRPLFGMEMEFSANSLIVEYIGYGIIPPKKENVKICPLNVQFDYVELRIGKNVSSLTYLPQQLEDVTTLTRTDFANLMLGNPDDACFIINGDKFQ